MIKIGLLACNSRASNTGELTGAAATEIVREYNDVGILSLPALANGVARQVAMAKEISHIIVNRRLQKLMRKEEVTKVKDEIKKLIEKIKGNSYTEGEK
jgi:hypothetical protein